MEQIAKGGSGFSVTGDLQASEETATGDTLVGFHTTGSGFDMIF